MGNVIGIPTTRVSDLYVRQRLTGQVQSDQRDMFRTQMQLSTGRRILMPSEDSNAAMRIVDLQRLLERKEQIQSNLSTNQSYLSATDTTLWTVSNSLAEIRAVALGVTGDTATDSQRTAAAEQVRRMIQQMQDVGNQMFRGRYLFAGTGTTVQPFEEIEGGYVKYTGNEGTISAFSDVDMLFETNLHGNEVFGAISEMALGSIDLDPVLTYDTRLADLRGGEGVTRGGILITVAGTTSTVDFGTAETIGDVAAMIRANAPAGKTLDVEITPSGLVIELDGAPGDTMTIREVGGGTTADELGILTESATAGPILGEDLNPVLRITTSVDDVLGTRSYVAVRTPGSDNDVIFEAPDVGPSYDGIKIVFDDDGSVAVPGTDETATYDPATQTLTVTVKSSETRAMHVVAAVQDAFALDNVPISARLDPLDSPNGGAGVVIGTPPGDDEGETAGGGGVAFDLDSGLQVVNGGQTHLISFAGAETFEDLLNTLNMSDAGLLAQINEDGTGINIRSRISGADFAIGENGGSTAAQLGLRTFTEATRLEDLNFGNGVANRDGTDFTITIAATLTGMAANPIEIDVDGIQTVGELLALINAQDPGNLQARLADYGNGIELVDLSSGENTLTVTRQEQSLAAVHLGLVDQSDPSSAASVGEGAAEVTVTSAAAHSDLVFAAVDPGTELNGVQIVFANTGTGTAVYDDVAGTLTFGITAGATTANDVITYLAADPVASTLFTAALDPADGSPNLGSGVVDVQTSAAMTGGTRTLTGEDTNTQETAGVFTALLRLQAALEVSDNEAIGRAIGLLDAQTDGVSFSRAELGARQQGLDTMQTRLESEEVELNQALSLDLDVDMIEAISTFTARQASFEASLRTTGMLFQATLLSYL